MFTKTSVIYSARKLLEEIASNASSLSLQITDTSPDDFAVRFSNSSNWSIRDPSYLNDTDNGNPYSPDPETLISHLHPSVSIIIIVLLSALFFMGFLSLYVRRGTSDDRNFYNRESIRYERPLQGLGRETIDRFPLVSFSLSKRTKRGKDTTECVVCLNEFEESETLRLLPKCGHAFHQECIDMWLFSHTTCPLCRRSLLHDTGSFRDVIESLRRLRSSSRANEQALNSSPDNVGNRGTEASVSIARQGASAGSNEGIRDRLGTQTGIQTEILYRPNCPVRGLLVGSSSGSNNGSYINPGLRRSCSTSQLSKKLGNQSSTETGLSRQRDSLRSSMRACELHRSMTYTTLSDYYGNHNELDTERSEVCKQVTQARRKFCFRPPSSSTKGSASYSQHIITLKDKASSSKETP